MAVDLATRFNGEIINGDAMQMYQGMPIITNQIPQDERKDIPHHLIATRTIEENPWRIGKFKRECLRIIEEIRSRGRLPILVGGTHYYTQGVLFNEPLLDEGESESEEQDDEKFAILKASTEEMLENLHKVDPVMAERWHPKERRKIRRSLEIYLQTGKPASEIYEEQKKEIGSHLDSREESLGSAEASAALGQLRYPTVIFWSHTERELLCERLASRVGKMADKGLIPEAEVLFNYLQQKESQGLEVDRTRGIWISIGFKELEPYFRAVKSQSRADEDLELLKEKCIESVITSTNQYAKSQVKWITGKLWKALLRAGKTRSLYILDSSNIVNWDTDVRMPAEDVTQAFLTGQACPDPRSLSEVANSLLTNKLKDNRGEDEFKVRTCECGVIVRSEAEWARHRKGKKHKQAMKYAKMYAYLNTPPPAAEPGT